MLLGDILKTGLAMTLVRFLFREQYGDILYLLALYAAAGSILGHTFPFYLGFKGGKGIACMAGLVIFFHPYMLLPQALIFFTIFFTTHYVSVGSLVAELVLIAEMVLFGQMGVWGMDQTALK